MGSDGNVECPNRDELWRQYEIQADLYKFHLKIALQSNVAFYAITGSIVSFYFANSDTASELHWSLLVPLLIAVAMIVICGRGSILLKGAGDDLSAIQKQLDLVNIPDVGILTLTLRLSASVYFVSALGLLFVLLRPGAFSGS